MKKWFENIIINYFSSLGFRHMWKDQIHGPAKRLKYRKDSIGTGSIFNTRSGSITIGHGCVVGHGCMFLTGRHLFEGGKLKQPKAEQVPQSGYDIVIKDGCWVASGAIVIGGVEIGEHSLVCAGAVVTKSFPPHSIIAGIPARQISSTLPPSPDA